MGSLGCRCSYGRKDGLFGVARASYSGPIDNLRSRGCPLSIKDGHSSKGECIAIDPKTGELLGGQSHRRHYGKAAELLTFSRSKLF
jgi:hypothetical protein